MSAPEETRERLAKLAEALRLCLREADGLGELLIGVHIANAIDAIECELGQSGAGGGLQDPQG